MSFTRNVAFGRSSTTSPSNSNNSSLAKFNPQIGRLLTLCATKSESFVFLLALYRAFFEKNTPITQILMPPGSRQSVLPSVRPPAPLRGRPLHLATHNRGHLLSLRVALAPVRGVLPDVQPPHSARRVRLAHGRRRRARAGRRRGLRNPPDRARRRARAGRPQRPVETPPPELLLPRGGGCPSCRCWKRHEEPSCEV